MITKKEEKKFMIIDLICFILSICGAILFTILFVRIKSDFRYMFLIFNLYSLFTFATSLRDIEWYFKKQKIEKKASLTSFQKTSIL